MPLIKKPPRHREEVVATVLYFGILGIDAEVVAELVESNIGDIVSPKECKERLQFASSILDQQGLPWTPAGVGEYIATFISPDTFATITVIDETCKEILAKASHDDKDFVEGCANRCR